MDVGHLRAVGGILDGKLLELLSGNFGHVLLKKNLGNVVKCFKCWRIVEDKGYMSKFAGKC